MFSCFFSNYTYSNRDFPYFLVDIFKAAADRLYVGRSIVSLSDNVFEQFLLLSLCFQMSSAANVSKCVYRWEKVELNRVERSVAKREITHHEQFLHLPQ